MSITFSLFFLSLTTLFTSLSCIGLSKPLPSPELPSPYISPIKFFRNYEAMLNKFKIFIYKPNAAFAYESPSESLFYTSLPSSPFATEDGEQAHLYFVPFPSDLRINSLSRVVREIRRAFPYWNRTLGADHVFISCRGSTTAGDRNVLELTKNAIQISCFPAPAGKFIPHKDVSLPAVSTFGVDTPLEPKNASARFLAYLRPDQSAGANESALVNQLTGDPDFLIDSGAPFDKATYEERLSSSKFCLFEYGAGASRIGEALLFGCVPAGIIDRPVQALPFMDVLTWQEIAVFVGAGGGVEELRTALSQAAAGDRYERMRRLGVAASKHFVWHKTPEPYDCFNTLMYQLWLRRFAIRYVIRDDLSLD
ncbi:putative glycosyltransferase [Morus notabilis]|uniref:Putative glycosyltransferase n=1 Tax=Morus notabilis TaxID=981085 RepID=W9S7J5_9ROSA|nr:probable glycosyltransferase At5g11130 [Morus notabilis]EXC19382.1 putative glycosyltransferase [Morus notabilis]